jgi:outer membrane protein assembly factor BamB
MIRPRRLSLLAGLAVLALCAASCDWTTFGFDAANTRSTPDNTVSASSIPSLVLSFTGNTGGLVGSSPAVANGVVYVVSDVNATQIEALEAFDAAGTSGCGGTPKVCAPLWTAPLGPEAGDSSPTVANGVVYVGSSNHLQAFDAAGTTGCGGTPKICSPLWSASVGPIGNSSPVVSNNVVYVGSLDDNLYAFDAAGATNCSGTPKTCLPLWTAPAGGPVQSSPAVANGTVYVGSDDNNLYAFDATGTTNCSGTPKTCSPLWNATTAGKVESSPAVANGTVYVGSNGPSLLYTNNLYAFDAAGATNCSGLPKTCSPLWIGSAIGGVESSPAVANGDVYVVAVGHIEAEVLAFDAAGNAGCSGTPKICTPLWTKSDVGDVQSSPSVANGLLYVAENFLNVFDAAGHGLGISIESCCSGPSSPAIANGMIYIGTSEGLSAFGLLHTQVSPPQTGRPSAARRSSTRRQLVAAMSPRCSSW